MTSRRTDPFEIMDVLVFREGTFRTTGLPVIREVLLEVRLDGRSMAAIACTENTPKNWRSVFFVPKAGSGRPGTTAASSSCPTRRRTRHGRGRS
jgi:hypothetical protein